MAPEVKTAKNSKLSKLPENCFERVGKGGWPLISTWIRGYVISLGLESLFIFETSFFIVAVFNNMSYSTIVKAFERRLTFVSSSSLLEPSYEIFYLFIKVVILVFFLLYGFNFD
jgi:hypothetical protein